MRKAGAPVAAVRGEVTRPKVEAGRPAARKVKLPKKPQKGFFDNLAETSFGLLIGVNLGLHVAMGVVFLYYWSMRGFK